MNNPRHNKIVHIVIISLLTVISFCVFYFSLLNQNNYNPSSNSENKDSLSGEIYYKASTEQVNLYVPDFIGFNTLEVNGVSEYDTSYIYDFITNFVLYEKNLYSAKVSYVKDSFKRGSMTQDGYVEYSIRFGINDSNIHTLHVRSSWADERIFLSISNNDDKIIFKKDFSGSYLANH